MKRLSAIVLSGLCSMSNPADAQTPTTGRDYSDLWWNAAESGWGMNVIHQDTILFITLFIYGADRKPTWYVASDVGYVGTNASGDDTYRGELYLTSGSPFNAVPFDAASTTRSSVGSITFTGLAAGGANVSYTVNGVSNGPVTKSTARVTWRNNVVNGVQYVGSTSYTRSQCPNPAENGPQVDRATYTLTVTGETLKLVEDNGPGKICNWNGTYTQSGRLGQSTGTTVCEDNVPATYTFTDLQVSPQSFGANFSARGGCSAAGRLGGTRK